MEWLDWINWTYVAVIWFGLGFSAAIIIGGMAARGGALHFWFWFFVLIICGPLFPLLILLESIMDNIRYRH